VTLYGARLLGHPVYILLLVSRFSKKWINLFGPPCIFMITLYQKSTNFYSSITFEYVLELFGNKRWAESLGTKIFNFQSTAI